jgi:nucleoside-diphosphate-sugar epimerase
MNESAFQNVNVEGSLTVLRQAVAKNLRFAIFFSTISVVDHCSRTATQGDLFDFVRDPHDAYLRSKIEAERRLMEESNAFAGNLVVIRPAFIYGPGNYSVWREALQLTLKGKMRLLDGGRALLPLIYAEDLARYVLALFEERPQTARYDLHVVSNRQTTTMSDVFNFIADYLGVSRPRSIPSLPLRGVAQLLQGVPLGMRPGRLKLLTPARVTQYSRGYDLSQVLFHPLLNKVQMTDYRVGLARMLDDFRS